MIKKKKWVTKRYSRNYIYITRCKWQFLYTILIVLRFDNKFILIKYYIYTYFQKINLFIVKIDEKIKAVS